MNYNISINTNKESDTFVGIKSDGSDVFVSFPLGYDLSETVDNNHKDIRTLINILSRFTEKKESYLPNSPINSMIEDVNFPIQSYLEVISYYLSNGYYIEKEVRYNKSNRGKIDWSRTIKTQKPYPYENSYVYLDFIVKNSVINTSSLITMINEYCVHESFSKLGWLFTSFMPNKPRIAFNKELFLRTIYSEIDNTYNDINKKLFSSMINIIKYIGSIDDNKSFHFGTNNFEYVWEKLVDFTYGIDNKEDYFPRTKWKLKNNKNKVNSALEPDTIMISDDKIFILDAKYYKYGETFLMSDLPNSSSINKQVTYSEYIYYHNKFKNEDEESPEIYNLFILPSNKKHPKYLSDLPIFHIGEAYRVWESSTNNYEKVQGVLVDVKHIMNNYIKQNKNEIMQLALLIESIFNDFD